MIARRIGPAPESLPLTVTVPEAAKLLGISRNLAFGLVRKGELPATRLGRRLVVSRKALERLLGDHV
jgi:excisionase family DNA binding protein